MSFPGHRGVRKHDGSTAEAWQTYVCGHCGSKVSGAVIGSLNFKDPSANHITRFTKWLLCPDCVKGSVEISKITMAGSIQTTTAVYPGAAFGPIIQGLPSDVNDAYSEARNCLSVNAFTAAELICRKILMHIAVEKGAKEGESFAAYLSYLETSGYITPPMKSWVDIIRKNGNSSTHKIESPNKERAESTVMFTAELLRLTYEMEFLANKFSA